MAEPAFLVHGVFWDTPVPALRLQDGDGALTGLALGAGTRLGFRLGAAGRSCLGHHKVHGPKERDHVLCPARAEAAKGSQCERCFVLDDSRLIHDFHRGGRVPPGLRAYLMQPHWLYVATFASGATKVGTAADLRKWHRLAEQGAVVARYVARAEDGRVVRVLEDMVTREAGLPQQVRSAAKAAALAAPLPAVEVDARNRALAGQVRTLLGAAAVDGFAVVDEDWARPALADAACTPAACTPAARHGYPHDLGAGEHGFRIGSLSGAVALAAIDGTELAFIVNLGSLKARTIVPGDFGSAVPAVQESLF